jgi:TolB-like protein/class 3 adenylate cyclase/predicted Zn-dependent protease
MSTEVKKEIALEIAHVLFTDIVGYSKLLTNEQRERLQLLNEIVRDTPQFKMADAAGKLVRVTTGDGMALVFFTSPDAPVRCAREISRKLQQHPELPLRMGVNSGPVDEVSDVNDRRNVAGAGINLAQRVMDCGDAGHILLSKRVADDLAQYGEWRPYLHELGAAEVKHGGRVELTNLYGDGFGNPVVPAKITRAEQERAKAIVLQRKLRRRRILLTGSAGLLLLLFVIIASWVWQRRVALSSAYKFGAAGIIEKSIAILPFQSFSDDKENAYLADGVQDDILTDLTKVADLKVIGRRSVAQYRDTKQTIREIGKALGVAHVLEGSVRKVAGRIHVTAQLIDTRTEVETWGEKYDRDIADVFQIQSDISQAIVTQLKVAFSPAEKAAIEEKPTQDKEAYDLYLRARPLVYDHLGLLQARIEENAAKAVPLLESAIARDPNFALAYCVLGDAKEILNDLVKAKDAIETALRISPNSAEAHIALARYFIHGVEDVPAGEKELSAAAAGLPGRVDVFNLRAEVEEKHGKWKEALRDREKAVELDPRDGGTVYDLCELYYVLRRYGDAEPLLDHMIATTPQQSTDDFWRLKSWIALAKGDAKAAMAALDSSPNRKPGSWGLNHMAANIFLMERNYAKAEEILQSAEETANLPKHGIRPGMRAQNLEQLGRIARFRGEKERARGYFEAAREQYLAKQYLAKTGHDSWAQFYSAAYIAEIDAALGRKEDAIREMRQVVEDWQHSGDARFAPDFAAFWAIIYMWTGERDAALQQLAEAVKFPTNLWWWVRLTAGELKLNPLWDDLRNDPRFDKIIAEAAKPVKLD